MDDKNQQLTFHVHNSEKVSSATYLNQQPLVRYYHAGRDPRVTMISPLEITAYRLLTEHWRRGEKRDHHYASV